MSAPPRLGARSLEPCAARKPTSRARARACLGLFPRRCGGVVLSNMGGKIVLDNTLETRLDLAMECRLPETRRVLFG